METFLGPYEKLTDGRPLRETSGDIPGASSSVSQRGINAYVARSTEEAALSRQARIEAELENSDYNFFAAYKNIDENTVAEALEFAAHIIAAEHDEEPDFGLAAYLAHCEADMPENGLLLVDTSHFTSKRRDLDMIAHTLQARFLDDYEACLQSSQVFKTAMMINTFNRDYRLQRLIADSNLPNSAV